MESKTPKPLDIGAHAMLLKKLFPQGRFISLRSGLIWSCELRPTPLSMPYTIKISYRPGKNPVINVTGCKLSKGEANTLPHVYSTEDQSLCLHLPPENSWTAAKNIADTIVPWAAEWLYHYEIWLVTGEWNGGGTVH